MKYCSKCGKQLLDEAVICPNCGCAAQNPKTLRPVYNDGVDIGLCVLSAIIPLFGIIYFLVARHEYPKRATPCGCISVIVLISCLAAWAAILVV